MQWWSDVEQQEVADSVCDSPYDEGPEVVYDAREAFREGAVLGEGGGDEVDGADEQVPCNDENYPSSEALAGRVDHLFAYA